MPLDGTVVSSIVNELNINLINGKIDKIYQTEKDELIIAIRCLSQSYKLLLSSNPSYPRIHLTNIAKENPATPPSFCMVLRKHLLGGKIVDISQPNFDRIVELHILSPNQIGDLTVKKLIIEIMGKHSNIILVDDKNKVIDSIKHISHQISSIREVLPGVVYFYPTSNKLNPLNITFEHFSQLLKNVDNTVLSKKLLNSFTGLSPQLSNEIVYRYSSNHDLYHTNLLKLWHEFNKIMSDIKNNVFTPWLYLDQTQNKPLDFSVVDMLMYKEYNCLKFDSTSVLIESFYQEKDRKDRINQKSEDIRKHLQILIDRNVRKIERLQEKLLESKDKEKYKIWGDLIFSSIHNIQKGQKELRIQNYFSETLDYISIPLNDQLSPSENAQKYYRQYNKLKNAEIASKDLLTKSKSEIEYLESVLNNIDNSANLGDILDIRFELEQEGYLHKSKYAKKNNSKSKLLKFISSDGFTILVGKNNLQNDELTLKTASKNDIWLHTKQIHGSHTIIITNNNQIPDSTLLEGAILAAYHSKAKNSSNVQVDYTTVKNVKKPSGAKPGMVIYVNYKTIVVTPQKSIVEKLHK